MYVISETFSKSSITFLITFFFRHFEAIKLNQTIKASFTTNNNDALTITSLLVDGYDKTLSRTIMKQNFDRLPLPSVYKNPS